jgi:hypothetical protein
MTALVLGEKERELLADLRVNALSNPIHLNEEIVEKLAHSKEYRNTHLMLMAKFTIDIPMGYAVTYTIETGHPAGPCRHMSMSVTTPSRMPSPEAVNLIAEYLGFVGGYEACTCWIENVGPNKQAINLIQPLDIQASGTSP